MRRAALSALTATLLLVACSSKTPNPGASASPSPSKTTSASPAPTKRSTHVVAARQALYVYQNAIWLYDVKTNTTRQVTQGGTVALPKWLDANHFSFVQGGNTLKIADLKTSTTSDVFTAPGGIQTYGWSPDGQTVAYIETDSSAYPHLRYRSVSDGATQSVATLARAPGRGVAPSDQLKIQYSKDGGYVLVVYTPADGDAGAPVPAEQSQFQVRGNDGSLSLSVDMNQDPTMGLFSRDGKTVYFMDKGGVRAWTAGSGATRTLRHMQWFDPWQSPDGRFVAYDSDSFSTKARVRILDLRTLTVKTISKPGRAFPIVAGPQTIWAEQVLPCADACDGPTLGAVFAIDTKTLAENQLPMQSLQDADVLYS
jgi:hypothetical protein